MVDGVNGLVAKSAHEVHLVSRRMQAGLSPNATHCKVLKAALLQRAKEIFAINFAMA